MRKIKTNILRVLFFVSLLCCQANAFSSEIFKWVDEKGKVHFTDSPPANQKTEQVELKINTYTAVEITPLVQRLGKKDKVVLYSAEWCGYCKKAKQHFTKNNISYVAYDVEKNRLGKREFKLLRGKSVPIIIIGNKRMNGFSPAKFDRLYENYLKEQAVANKNNDV